MSTTTLTSLLEKVFMATSIDSEFSPTIGQDTLDDEHYTLDDEHYMKTLAKKAATVQLCTQSPEEVIPMFFRKWESLSHIQIQDIKESGMSYENIRRVIDNISEDPFAAVDRPPSNYLRRFDIDFKCDDPAVNIFLAKIGSDIVGFIITDSYVLGKDCDFEVKYVVVDSKIQKSGIGTKLMFAAMMKARKLGYEYLRLNYYIGKGEKKEYWASRVEFYNSFYRYGISRDIQNYQYCRGVTSLTISYNLKIFNEIISKMESKRWKVNNFMSSLFKMLLPI